MRHKRAQTILETICFLLIIGKSSEWKLTSWFFMLLNAAYVIFWYTICFMVFHLLILVIAIQLWSFSLHIFVKTVGNHKTAAYFIDYHRYMFACSFRDKGLIIIRRGEKGGLCCWRSWWMLSTAAAAAAAAGDDSCLHHGSSQILSSSSSLHLLVMIVI